MGVKLHLLRGISVLRTGSPLELFLVSKCVVELSQVAEGQKERCGYKFTRLRRRQLEMAATLEYTCMSKCAVLFPPSLTIKPTNIKHFLYCLIVYAFSILGPWWLRW